MQVEPVDVGAPGLAHCALARRRTPHGQTSAIHTLYNRALRDDPSLQGKVVLELKIASSGAVVDCRIASSELKTEELERKLLARIRQFDFGAKDVEVMVVSWPVDFLPS